MSKPIQVEGKDAAQHYNVFHSGYRIIKGHPQHGTAIAGVSPDGRYTGTCDRCGTAILNVSCFESGDPDYPGFMHVGIDCAQRMGVPLAELRKARVFVKNHEQQKRREAVEKAAQLSRQQREAKMREIHKVWLDRLAIVSENSNASDFERDWCARQEGMLVSNSADPECMSWGILEAAEIRLALCESSVARTEKAVTETFTVYRKPIALEGFYGVTILNFLHDPRGNAYVYKGNQSFGYAGSEFTATFSVKGSETRDGLTSTLINRPRKVTTHSWINREGYDEHKDGEA